MLHRGREVWSEVEFAFGRELGVECANLRGLFVGPVAARLAHREAKSLRQHHGVVRDVLRGIEVLREEGRRDVRECFGGVGEAFARGTVGRELARRLQIDAGEVADGVVELGVTEPAQWHAAGVALVGPRLRIEKALHPRHEFHLLLGTRLRPLLRRHLARLDLLDHPLPRLHVLANVVDRPEPLQVEAPFLQLRGVATEAVLLK